MRHHNHGLIGAATAVVWALGASLSEAQDSASPDNEAAAGGLQLEEVIVSAQKREQRIQEVPISVSALSGEKLDTFAVAKLDELQGYLPNVTIVDEQITSRIVIRGIGSGGNQGFDQSVGLFSEGVYLARGTQFRSGFLDVGRMEVLRGPQSTLFGRNTIAGAINLTSRKPTNELEMEFRGNYETEYGDSEYTALVSGPMTSSLKGRVVFQHGEREGFMRNAAASRDEPQRDTDNYRGILVWDVTDKLTLTGQFEGYELQQEGRDITILFDENLSVDGSGTLVSTPICRFAQQCGLRYVSDVSNNNGTPGFDRNEYSDIQTKLGVFTVSYALGRYDLKAITGWASSKMDEINDGDRRPASSSTTNDRQVEDFSQVSQEIRIESPLGGTLDWIAGVYFEHGELDFDENIAVSNLVFGNTLPGNLWIQTDFAQESDSMAVFGQGTWHFTPDLRLTAGVRGSKEKKEASLVHPLLLAGTSVRFADVLKGLGVPPANAEAMARGIGAAFNFDEFSVRDDRSQTHLSPMLSLQWDPVPGTMVYASAAIGYKSGGFDPRLARSRDSFEFDDEKATTFELGAKSVLLDGAAEINAAAFFTKYENLQFSSFNGGLSFLVDNAADAEVKGIEMDGRWRATEKLTLNAAAAFTDFEFTSFPNGPCDIYQQLLANFAAGSASAACAVDRSGDTNQNVPEVSGVIGAEWRTPLFKAGQLVIGADALYESAFFTTADLDPVLKQDAYWKLNARIELTGGDNDRWSIALIGKNLTDETTYHWGNDVPLTSGARQVRLDAPRTIAIQARLRY